MEIATGSKAGSLGADISGEGGASSGQAHEIDWNDHRRIVLDPFEGHRMSQESILKALRSRG